jgi:hypothetical protein
MPEIEKDWKITARVSKEFYDLFEKQSKELHMTKSQLGNMCLQAGLRALLDIMAFTEENMRWFLGDRE